MKQIKAIPPNVLWDLNSSELYGILQDSLWFLRSKWWHEFEMAPNIQIRKLCRTFQSAFKVHGTYFDYFLHKITRVYADSQKTH